MQEHPGSESRGGDGGNLARSQHWAVTWAQAVFFEQTDADEEDR